MAITLINDAGLNLRLPDGLVWEDESAWSPVAQATEYTLTGALILEEATKAAGRPITLVGGRSGLTSWAWLTRTEALALKAALDAPGLIATLTLHDARTFRVTPRRDADAPPVEVRPLPAQGDRPISDPKGTTTYILDRVRFLEVPV